MPDSILEDLCKQPTLKAPSGEYAKLVHDSTTELHEPIQSILSALDRRAMGLSKCANFESAFRDAKAMQHLSPSSALGYIREATIYSGQGKQRCAIDICNKGLDKVDTDDKHYATLQQVKTEAEQRQNNTRIDFIKQLPMDIVITTLVPMMMDDSPISSTAPSPYLYVSNVWRDRIVQCFDGLRFKVEKSRDLSHVLELSRYIRRLDLDPGSEDAWFCDLLRNNDFISLRELSIDWYHGRCADPLFSSLASIGSTLTHFEVYLEHVSIAAMADVLQPCPNLVLLDIMQSDVPDFTSLARTTWPKLTTFAIMCDGDPSRDVFTRDQIASIPKHFPSLKKLAISPCEDTQMTRILLDHYPRMKRIELSHGPYVQVTFLEQATPCEEDGITDLFIESDRREIFAWKFLADELRQHQDTLESIQCNMFFDDKDEEEDEDVLEDIHPIEYRRLKRLDLNHYGWWFTRHAPMLEELKMTADTITENVAVLDTIPPKLRKLELELDQDINRHYQAHLERYLHGISQRSQLKELIIDFWTMKDIGNIPKAIRHLDQLERLTVIFATKWDYRQMERFIGGIVNGCQKLACLEISCFNPPSTYCLEALKQLDHLEQFAFSINGMGRNDSFWRTIESISQLKRIRIHPASAARMDDIRCLQKQRPDLNIIVDRSFTRFGDHLQTIH